MGGKVSGLGSVEIKAQYLAATPFSIYLTDKQIHEFANVFSLVKFHKGENVFKKASPADKWFMIGKGTVSIEDEESKDNVYLKQSGDFFGEDSILPLEALLKKSEENRPPRKYGVVVVSEECEVLEINRAKLVKFLNKQPLQSSIFKLVSMRMENFLADITCLKSAYPRELKTLSSYVRYYPLRKGSTLFEEGSRGTNLYFVCKGSLSVISQKLAPMDSPDASTRNLKKSSSKENSKLRSITTDLFSRSKSVDISLNGQSSSASGPNESSTSHRRSASRSNSIERYGTIKRSPSLEKKSKCQASSDTPKLLEEPSNEKKGFRNLTFSRSRAFTHSNSPSKRELESPKNSAGNLTSGSMDLMISGAQYKTMVNLFDFEPVKVATLSDGDFFGEIGSLTAMPRTATIIADEDSLLLEITRENLEVFFKTLSDCKEIIEKAVKFRIIKMLRKYNVAILNAIPEEKYDRLSEICTINMFGSGETIFSEGDVGNELYIIAHGELEVIINKPVVGPIRVTTMLPGKYFGEVAIVKNTLRTATVKVIEPCVLLKITKEDFEVFFEEFPEAIADFQVKLAKYDAQLKHFVYHPLGLEYFTKHLEDEYSTENINFWKECYRYKLTPIENIEERREIAENIKRTYLDPNSAQEINIPGSDKIATIEKINSGEFSNNLFKNCINEVFTMMERDSFKRFKESKLFAEFLAQADTYSVDNRKNSKKKGHPRTTLTLRVSEEKKEERKVFRIESSDIIKEDMESKHADIPASKDDPLNSSNKSLNLESFPKLIDSSLLESIKPSEEIRLDSEPFKAEKVEVVEEKEQISRSESIPAADLEFPKKSSVADSASSFEVMMAHHKLKSSLSHGDYPLELDSRYTAEVSSESPLTNTNPLISLRAHYLNRSSSGSVYLESGASKKPSDDELKHQYRFRQSKEGSTTVPVDFFSLDESLKASAKKS
jgi:CRP-like cAMP-binding protein